MTEEAAEANADAVALGARIREFRQLRRISLRELGLRVQTSAGFLSQLERGTSSASIATLRRIASALGLTVADLFRDPTDSDSRVLRKADRALLNAGQGVEKFLISQAPLRHVEVYVVTLQPGASSGDALQHGNSQEILLVAGGEVMVELGNKQHQLGDGDSIEYDSSVPHRVVNAGDTVVEVTWIVSPPNAERRNAQSPPIE